jgi:hypothetical protein
MITAEQPTGFLPSLLPAAVSRRSGDQTWAVLSAGIIAVYPLGAWRKKTRPATDTFK